MSRERFRNIGARTSNELYRLIQGSNDRARRERQASLEAGHHVDTGSFDPYPESLLKGPGETHITQKLKRED